MFDFVSGELVRKAPTEVVVDCGGIGYRLGVSLHTFSSLPDSGRVRLLVHPVYSENDQRLFGFAEDSERILFRLLQAVRGVGPALAIAILSHDSPDVIIRRLRDGDTRGLTGIKGIGRKTAERLVLELKDRLPEVPAGPAGPAGRHTHEALLAQALGNLGMTPAEAAERARQVLRSLPDETHIEVLLREALRTGTRSASR